MTCICESWDNFEDGNTEVHVVQDDPYGHATVYCYECGRKLREGFLILTPLDEEIN